MIENQKKKKNGVQSVREKKSCLLRGKKLDFLVLIAISTIFKKKLQTAQITVFKTTIKVVFSELFLSK